MNSSITIRQLGTDDYEQFRAFRLAALTEAPGNFYRSRAEEETMAREQWLQRLDGRTSAIFGLFDGEVLIGITSVYTDPDDPSGATAAFAMTYLKPAYRGRGLVDLFYKARLEWTRARSFNRLRVWHRAGNAASKRAIERHGFRFVGASSPVWPDGGTDDDVAYELLL
jgi:RimJ/RimL family protein N-acetyltransferase